MATKTRAELIAQVLDNLGVISRGQAPTDNDISKVDGVLDPIFASLDGRDVVSIDEPGTPDPPTGGEYDLSIFLALADVVANRCAGSFNLAGDAQLFVLSQKGEEEMRILTAPSKTRKFLRTDSAVSGNRSSRNAALYTINNFNSGR